MAVHFQKFTRSNRKKLYCQECSDDIDVWENILWMKSKIKFTYSSDDPLRPILILSLHILRKETDAYIKNMSQKKEGFYLPTHWKVCGNEEGPIIGEKEQGESERIITLSLFIHTIQLQSSSSIILFSFIKCLCIMLFLCRARAFDNTFLETINRRRERGVVFLL